MKYNILMVNKILLLSLLLTFVLSGGTIYPSPIGISPYGQSMCSGNLYNQVLTYAQSCFYSQYNYQIGQPTSCNPSSNYYQFTFPVNSAVYQISVNVEPTTNAYTLGGIQCISGTPIPIINPGRIVNPGIGFGGRGGYAGIAGGYVIGGGGIGGGYGGIGGGRGGIGGGYGGIGGEHGGGHGGIGIGGIGGGFGHGVIGGGIGGGHGGFGGEHGGFGGGHGGFGGEHGGIGGGSIGGGFGVGHGGIGGGHGGKHL
jgi:hypothetical protein